MTTQRYISNNGALDFLLERELEVVRSASCLVKVQTMTPRLRKRRLNVVANRFMALDVVEQAVVYRCSWDVDSEATIDAHVHREELRERLLNLYATGSPVLFRRRANEFVQALLAGLEGNRRLYRRVERRLPPSALRDLIGEAHVEWNDANRSGRLASPEERINRDRLWTGQRRRVAS